MTFELNKIEEENLEEFCKKHRHPEVNKGAIGGHISIHFAMTSIGDMASAHCSICDESEPIADYGKF